jgi:hypothetical protein
LETSIPCEEIENFRIIGVICWVWGKNSLACRFNKFPTILGSYSIPGIDFSLHNLLFKNTGSDKHTEDILFGKF